MVTTRASGERDDKFKKIGSMELTMINDNIYKINITLQQILTILNLKFNPINPLFINEYENDIINSHDEIPNKYMVFHSVKYESSLPIINTDDITLLVYKEIISSTINKNPERWSDLWNIHKIFKKINGKIYFVCLNYLDLSSKENYLIFIPDEKFSSGYSQSFKLTKCFNEQRDQHKISITTKKTFNIIEKPQLYSIFIRMLMCCDRVHDLKGRSTPKEKNVIMGELNKLIISLYNQAKNNNDDSDPFYKMIIDIYYLWYTGNVWSSVEESMIILFLKNFSGELILKDDIYTYGNDDIEIEFIKLVNDITNITDIPAVINISNITDVIDNAMGREHITYKVIGNKNPVIYPSTFIDGGTSLCRNNKSNEIKPAIPYEINFQDNWSIKRDFVVLDSSFVEKVKDDIIVNSKMVQDQSPKLRKTDIYCLLNEKYTAKKVSNDEYKLINNKNNKNDDFKVNVDWKNITQCNEGKSYKIMDTAIKTTFYDHNNSVKYADSLWTKTLGDLGQNLETISIDSVLANNTLTCHNDRCAAIMQICFQMVLNKGCTSTNEKQDIPNITSAVFLNSPSKKIYSKYQGKKFIIHAVNCINNNLLLKMKINFKRKRENSPSNNSNNSTRKKAKTGGSNTNVKHNKLDDLEIYEIYRNGLFSENVYESQNFNFKLTGKFLDTLEVMEQPLEKRSLIHFMLRTDEKTFRKLYNKLTKEDQKEFKSFIEYNTTLMHDFCKKTGHNLEYPYVDDNGVLLEERVQLKTINLNELIGKINDYIDNKNTTQGTRQGEPFVKNNGKPGQEVIKSNRENSQSNMNTRKSSNKSSNKATIKRKRENSQSNVNTRNSSNNGKPGQRVIKGSRNEPLNLQD